MRIEKDILKDFEKLGYAIDNDENHCDMENEYNKKNILINKKLLAIVCCKFVLKPYETFINGTKMKTNCVEVAEPGLLSINEFELLHELFAIWGWLDE